jgi:hypothetical protein
MTRYALQQPEEVTRSLRDTWEFDFTIVLGVGETVASGAATLIQLFPPTMETVAGFVTSVSASTPDVLVTVTGAVLTIGFKYSLEVTATLNTAAVVPKTLLLNCVR